MIDKEFLEKTLCQTFCSSVTVNPVPCGYAVSAIFLDSSGDRIGCYVVKDGDGFRIEDDGEYLAHLIGSGIDIDRGFFRQFLNSILKQSDASLDQDNYIIRSQHFHADQLCDGLLRFIASLIRVRDLEIFVQEEMVRFISKDDQPSAIFPLPHVGTTDDKEMPLQELHLAHLASIRQLS